MDQPAQALGHARHLDRCVTSQKPTHLEAFPRVCECSEQRSEIVVSPVRVRSRLGGLADESLAARVPSAFSHNC